MPPIPSPVTTRHSERSTRPLTVVAMNMPVAMTTRQPRIVGRRPILSATPPRRTEPIAMPISSIESTMPSWARSMPHSAAMPGEAKLIESTSKPSSAFSAMVRPITITWSRLIGEVAMRSRGSVCNGSPFLDQGDTILTSARDCTALRANALYGGWGVRDSGSGFGVGVHGSSTELEPRTPKTNRAARTRQREAAPRRLLLARARVVVDRRRPVRVERLDGLQPPRLALLALGFGPDDRLPVRREHEAGAGVGDLDPVAARLVDV